MCCTIEIGIFCFKFLIIFCSLVFFILMALLFFHGYKALTFPIRHSEMTSLFGFLQGAVEPYIFCIFDLLLACLGLVGLYFKFKYIKDQYLSSKNKTSYLWIIICSVLLCVVLFILSAIMLILKYTGDDDFEEAFSDAVHLYPKPPYKDLIDRLQIKYKCCGYSDYRDWVILYEGVNVTDYLPDSCCKGDKKPCLTIFPQNTNNKSEKTIPTYWETGCNEKYENIYLYDYQFISLIGFCVVGCQILYSILDKIIQSGINETSDREVHECYVCQKRFQNVLFYLRRNTVLFKTKKPSNATID